MNSKNEIHSVELKNKIQEEIAQEMKEMLPLQEIDYFRQGPKDKSLRTWWDEVKKNQAKHGKKAS